MHAAVIIQCVDRRDIGYFERVCQSLNWVFIRYSGLWPIFKLLCLSVSNVVLTKFKENLVMFIIFNVFNVYECCKVHQVKIHVKAYKMFVIEKKSPLLWEIRTISLKIICELHIIKVQTKYINTLSSQIILLLEPK